MADLSQVEAALIKADAAGDAEGARVLAGEVRRLRGAPVASSDDASANGPLKIGAAAFPDALRETLQGTDWGTRNIAGMGSAVTGVYEGAKQLFGQGNRQAIEANKIIEDEAPIGSFAGNVALTALPFSAAGNSLKAAGAIGAGFGALQPVQGEQSFGNVAQGKAINTALGGGLGVAGQVVANKTQSYLAAKLQQLMAQKAKNAVLDTTLRESVEAGYKVPPSMMPDSGVGSRMLEGLSGKFKTNQAAGIKNQAVTDSLARKAVGLADDAPLTSEAMQQIRTKAFKSGYEPVSSVGAIKTDKAYQNAMDSIVGNHQGAARSFPGAVSDDVSTAILGKEFGGTPDKKLWVDDFGKVLKDFTPPQEPQMRSLLHELKQGGGLSTAEVADLGTDGVHKAYPGLLRKDGGKTMDRVVEWMGDHGWLSSHDIALAEKNNVGGSHELARDMIRGALNKEPVIHPADGNAFYDYQSALQRLSNEGVKQMVIPGEKAVTKGGLKVAEFDAGDAIKMTQILRDEAGSAFAQGDKALGKAKREAAKAIEDQIERGLLLKGKDGVSLLKGFRDARQAMAKAHTIEDAIREGGGRVDAMKLGARFQAGKPLIGELATIGKFANNFGREGVAGIPKSGNASPFTALDFMQTGLSAPLGMIAGGPAGAAAALGVPAARVGARYGLLSDMMQRGMSRPDYALGFPTRTLGSLLKNAPVAGTVGGMYAFGQ